MSPSAPIEPTKKRLPESSSSGELSPERADLENPRRFGALRGVQWRIYLGILPSSSSSVDEFRRVTANSRRSYAALRRRLLINPPISKDESNFRDHVMDNPLSQNPDSMWGRFFHKAELEKMVDQDLSRLYPEHGSYFQTPGCQGVLRRILLLWCIRHPNIGYRQGMHELLAPLLYVLQSDLECISEVRKKYQDYFTDNFDGLSFNEPDLEIYSSDDIGLQKDQEKVKNFNDLDPKTQTIISFCDAYGAEGELGIVLSEKFIEHDAYNMFDALMNGNRGAVKMASFFSHSPSLNSGLPPVIEASSGLYNLLSVVDLSLYSHLVELGVEPQYFALRWLRVLFGREFALEGILVIWDEIFELDNSKLTDNESEITFGVLNSLRGAFISAFAVTMILYLRSSLLATENATSCLQRLLNFPQDVNLVKLIKKAKSLMNLAIESVNSVPEAVRAGGGPFGQGRNRGRSLSTDLTGPGSSRGLVRESYWEEQWRVLNKETEQKTEQKQGSLNKQVQNRLKSWSDKVKFRLSRTDSARFLSKVARAPVGRNLVDDLARLEDDEKLARVNDVGEEKFSIFSDPLSPRAYTNNSNNNNNNINNNENDIDRSSVGSCPSLLSGMYSSTEEVASPLPISDPPEEMPFKEVNNELKTGDSVTNLTDKRPLSGKFQWLWMFARNGPDDPNTEFDNKNAEPSSSTTHKQEDDDDDQNKMCSLKNLAESMIENIQVIEYVLHQEKAQTENAITALKELRKISNILSEM